MLRHAESAFNAHFERTGRDPQIADPVLTPRGVAQAEAAARHFVAMKKDASAPRAAPTRILCSPYTRALQTASILAKALGLGVEATPLLGERALYSCDTGTPAAQLKKLWPDVAFGGLDERWWPRPGESGDETNRRAHAFLALYGEGGGRILAVSHWYLIFALSGADCANAKNVWIETSAGSAKRRREA